MIHHLTSTNVSFAYLKNSSDFLNILVNNICSCVLLLNKNMELQAFNDSLKTIFSNKPDESLLYMKCGEAIGCAHSVEEIKECGKTSQCYNCELRLSALYSYVDKKIEYRKKISRYFYKTDNKKELKHLQYSTRPFYFEDDFYILLIIDDITDFECQKEVIEDQKRQIQELKSFIHGSNA
jgi:sigma-B regulation protein RsbU (phosphoserine phosphatase)